MDYIVSPKVNAQVAEYFGEAPANLKACQQTSDKRFCDGYHAADAAYADADLLLDDADQAVPRRPHDVTCTDYAEWTKAWQEIKG